jgi:hypothetical protein
VKAAYDRLLAAALDSDVAAISQGRTLIRAHQERQSDLERTVRIRTRCAVSQHSANMLQHSANMLQRGATWARHVAKCRAVLQHVARPPRV